MDVAFENVEVNSAPVPGNQVFKYVPEVGISTAIKSWVENETGRHTIISNTTNQSDEWKKNRTLHFDIGTIRLNQTWEATFRLQVLDEGTISLFGDGATITFNERDRVPIPRVYITAFGEENTTMDTWSLNVTNLNCASPVTEFLSMTWDLNYTGKGEAMQEISCTGDDGYIRVLDTLTSLPGAHKMEACFDVRDLPPGEYTIRVHATAPDAPVSQDTCLIRIGDGQKAYIRIQ